MRCAVCSQVTEAYQPTGTNVLRAVDHYERDALVVCAGSYGLLVDEATYQRDRERTREWRARKLPALPAHLDTSDVNDYLRQKGVL